MQYRNKFILYNLKKKEDHFILCLHFAIKKIYISLYFIWNSQLFHRNRLIADKNFEIREINHVRQYYYNTLIIMGSLFEKEKIIKKKKKKKKGRIIFFHIIYVNCIDK